MHPSKESRLEALVERFWELEAVPKLKDSAKYSPEQLACEKSFKDNVRFEVSLPFKIDPKILGSSFETAKRRFLSLERRVSKDLELKEIFIARRGVPSRIYSDNATNFVGTNNLLRELQEAFERQRTSLQSFAAEKGMEWCFIPPREPHFGGLWEAAVKSAKHLLLRQIGSASLVESEVRGHLADVEAILNSRPLTPLSGDPNDGEALTPGHLLIGQPLRSLPQGSEPDTPSSGISCSRRWQLLSMLRQWFWRAWSKDYVHSLQLRGKWTAEQPNLAIGALEVIHEDNTPPQRWTTGRIVEVVPGADGRIRVADVKTAVGVCRRPIHKLAVLPIV
ncbi:hypothetical protein ACLKA6_016853 [Drosophila palustris]